MQFVNILDIITTLVVEKLEIINHFKEQIKLAVDLVKNGIDNYPKNDFNKNNLINAIPEPEIVYQSKHITVYGAGALIGGKL